MKLIWLSISYFNYLFTSKSINKAHSPFVYEFIKDVLKDKTQYKEFSGLHRYRKKICRSTTIIDTVDFGSGAGKKDYISYHAKVGKLAKNRTHSKKQLELIYKISKYFKPRVILEMGTAVGISTLYLQKGHREAKIISMEGCAGLVHYAEKVLKTFKATDVKVITGNFNNTLLPTLEGIDNLDLVFFDGNHRKDATLAYFEACLDKINESSVFMFDDIHYSPGMSKAWKTIKEHEDVSFTIDLFWLGLVFFKKGIAKQDFVIRY